MKRILSFAIIAVTLITASAADSVPRDTSFTLNSAYRKIARKYPFARPVPQTVPEGIRVIRDVVYKQIDSTQYGSRLLHLDIFRADSLSHRLPAVLMIHGGGWSSGEKNLQYPLAAALAKRGYAAIPVEYRLTPEAKYPAALHDVKAALRWVRLHGAEYGIDTSRVAIAGCSAGGQLAALVGVTNGSVRHEGKKSPEESPARADAVICIDGITTFVSDYNLADVYERRDKHNGLLPVNAQWLGGMPDEARENWNEASAINWVTPQSAPICFINSDLPRYRDGRDEIRPLLENVGVYSEIHSVHSPIHPFWLFHPWYYSTARHAADFLDKILK